MSRWFLPILTILLGCVPALAQAPAGGNGPGGAEPRVLVPVLPERQEQELHAARRSGGTAGTSMGSSAALTMLHALRTLVSADFVDAPVTDVLRCLELEANRAFLHDREVTRRLDRRCPRVTVRFQRVTLARALRETLEPCGLCAAVRGGDILIVRQERVPEQAGPLPAPPGPPVPPPAPVPREAGSQLPPPCEAPVRSMPETPVEPAEPLEDAKASSPG